MISVCILNWNRVETLKSSLENLISLQLVKEIIVYDQNSTDGSVELLQEIKNDKIKVILSPFNTGNSTARNHMIQLANQPYLFLLDSDIVPIDDSLQELFFFLQKNTHIACVGYDYENYSTKNEKITSKERGIELADCDLNTTIALTQYGLFRKKVFEVLKFPTFYPFNKPGWGAEDDILGLGIKALNLGLIAKVNGRTYLHKSKKSSWENFQEDEILRLYNLRYIYYLYFKWFLNNIQKVEVLKGKDLPKTKLDLSKYYYRKGNNLGDEATDYIFKTLFPFFELTEKSNNLLFFGGTIFNHIPNAEKLYNRKFKNILMLGVGISSEEEIKELKSNYVILPRGEKTKQILESKKIKTHQAIGDILQLFTLLPKVETTANKTLYIEDVYSNTYELPEKCKRVKVSTEGPFANPLTPYVTLDAFLTLLRSFNKVISSQIHPFLISVLLGRSGKLIPKDFRAEDLMFFKKFKLEVTEKEAIELRVEILKNLHLFIHIIMSYFYQYSPNYDVRNL